MLRMVLYQLFRIEPYKNIYITRERLSASPECGVATSDRCSDIRKSKFYAATPQQFTGLGTWFMRDNILWNFDYAQKFDCIGSILVTSTLTVISSTCVIRFEFRRCLLRLQNGMDDRGGNICAMCTFLQSQECIKTLILVDKGFNTRKHILVGRIIIINTRYGFEYSNQCTQPYNRQHDTAIYLFYIQVLLHLSFDSYRIFSSPHGRGVTMFN